MTDFCTTSVGDASKARSKITNDPIRAQRHGRGAAGRRIRDLFRSYVTQLGNPEDAATQAGVLAAAELIVAAEVARADLLAGRGDLNAVVRIENLSARALRRLGLGKPAPKPTGPTLADIAARYARPAVALNGDQVAEQPTVETRTSEAPTGPEAAPTHRGARCLMPTEGTTAKTMGPPCFGARAL